MVLEPFSKIGRKQRLLDVLGANPRLRCQSCCLPIAPSILEARIVLTAHSCRGCWVALLRQPIAEAVGVRWSVLFLLMLVQASRLFSFSYLNKFLLSFDCLTFLSTSRLSHPELLTLTFASFS